MAGSNTPGWRRAFNKAERAVGEPLEKAIETREFANMMSVGAKVRKGVQRQIYGSVNRTLHFVGLSTLKDTRDIARQLNRVQAQLREVSSQLEYLEEREQVREGSETTDQQLEQGEPARALPRNAAATASADVAAAPAKKAPPAKKAAPAKKTTPAKKAAPAKKTSPAAQAAPVDSASPAKESSPATSPSDPLAADASPADVPANPSSGDATPDQTATSGKKATSVKTAAPGKKATPSTPAQNDTKGA